MDSLLHAIIDGLEQKNNCKWATRNDDDKS